MFDVSIKLLILNVIERGGSRERHVPKIVPQHHHFLIFLDFSYEFKVMISSMRLVSCTSSFLNECAYTLLIVSDVSSTKAETVDIGI